MERIYCAWCRPQGRSRSTETTSTNKGCLFFLSPLGFVRFQHKDISLCALDANNSSIRARLQDGDLTFFMETAKATKSHVHAFDILLRAHRVPQENVSHEIQVHARISLLFISQRYCSSAQLWTTFAYNACRPVFSTMMAIVMMMTEPMVQKVALISCICAVAYTKKCPTRERT